MVTYIYFVKCPNCEDEHFDFFDEAKEFALGCLSQKPIITQTEVCRNDFGECTDSTDLGTVWSWEDIMDEGGYTDAEPTKSIFTKDDLKLMADGQDPEFDELDNSVDYEPETSEVSPIVEDSIPRNPAVNATRVPKDSEYVIVLKHPNTGKYYVLGRNYKITVDVNKAMTYPDKFSAEDEIKYAEDAAEERGFSFVPRDNDNPDSYFDDYPSVNFFVVTVAEAKKLVTERKPIPEGMTIEQLVEEMEENEDTVECTWCEDLFDKSECRYEVDLGWLCSRCEMAIKSRGETLTFREGNYWDFLDEDADTPKNVTWGCYWDGEKIGTVEATTEDEATYKMQHEYPEYPYGMYKHDDCYWVEPEDKLTEALIDDNDNSGFAHINDALGWLAKHVNKIRDIYGKGPHFVTKAFPDFVKSNETGKTDTSKYSAGAKYIYTTSIPVAIEAGVRGLRELETAVKSDVERFDDEVKPHFFKKAANDFLSDAIDKAFSSIELTYKIEKLDPFAVRSTFTGSPYEITFTLTVVLSNKLGKNDVNYKPQYKEDLNEPKETIDLEYDNIGYASHYIYSVDKDDVVMYLWDHLLTDEDAADVPGGLEALEDDALWEKFLDEHFDDLFKKYEEQILDHYYEDAKEDSLDNYSKEDAYHDYWSDRADSAYSSGDFD